jgi:hypothetical protein
MFGRFKTSQGADIYDCGRMTTPAESERQYRHSYYSAGSRSGQLRLSRRGSVVTCLAAENDRDDFRAIHEFELGTPELNLVRVAADTGNFNNSVEVRAGDFEIRASGVPAEASPEASRRWRPLMYPTLAIPALILCAAGLWLWRRRRQQERLTTAKNP